MENLNGNERWHKQWRRAYRKTHGKTESCALSGSVQGSDCLDAKTEAELIARWRESRDQAAGHRLFHCYRRLIQNLAYRYRGFGVGISDLVAEGNIGLLQALDRFDLSRGFRLSTYAVWWIRAAMSEAVLNAPTVKAVVGEEAKRLFFNLSRVKTKLGVSGTGDLSPDAVGAIAQDLAVRETEVVRMNRWLNGRDVSLNTPIERDACSSGALQDLLFDANQDDEARIIHNDERRKQAALVRQFLAALNERERYIVTERWLKEEPRTLADIGGEYGLTRERVRQIEASALKKLKKKARTSALMEGQA
jgi:RNA polymerase sigma-32 factor